MIHTDNDGYLNDKLLIATHSIRDGCFDKTLIYICAHNHQGAMGMIVNMPLTGISVKALLDELKMNYEDQLPEYPIHFGGPVDTNQGFVLHTDDRQYKGTIVHDSGICFSAGISLLEDLAKGCGPEKLMVSLGCAGWAAGQLEHELEAGSWLVAPATKELLFDTPATEQWSAAAGHLGVDLDRLSSHVGHA